MAVSSAPMRIDFLHRDKLACGYITTHTDGVATITTPFQKVYMAVGTVEAATPDKDRDLATVQSITAGSVVFAVIDSADAGAGDAAVTLHYTIIGY